MWNGNRVLVKVAGRNAPEKREKNYEKNIYGKIPKIFRKKLSTKNHDFWTLFSSRRDCSRLPPPIRDFSYSSLSAHHPRPFGTSLVSGSAKNGDPPPEKFFHICPPHSFFPFDRNGVDPDFFDESRGKNPTIVFSTISSLR